jgi:rod shape-determining protein MreC
MGIIRFDPSRGLMLSHFPRRGKIAVGDTLITSGLGEVYPPNLLIGTVMAVDYPNDQPECEVFVEPAADLRSVDELFVLIPESRL